MRRRDPHTDPAAALPDFVYRLRRMGYPGNVRVEFPIFMASDVAWCAKILSDTAPYLIHISQDTSVTALIRVLRARAALVQMDRELKLRTTHRQVKQMRGV